MFYREDWAKIPRKTSPDLLNITDTLLLFSPRQRS